MKTILLLENDPEVMKILRLVLGRNGYTLLECNDPETALRIGDTKHIDLLIVEVTPPCCDIYPIFQLKKSMPDAQLILTFCYPPDTWDEKQRAELFDVFFDSVRVLRKPFFPAELIRTTEELIGRATGCAIPAVVM